MNRSLKILLLIGLLLVLAILTVIQSRAIYHNLRNDPPPISRSRQSGDPKAQGWMNVREVARQYNVTEKDVFDALQIDPGPGDEKLSLRALSKKYHKTREEMQFNMRRLIGQPSPEKP